MYMLFVLTTLGPWSALFIFYTVLSNDVDCKPVQNIDLRQIGGLCHNLLVFPASLFQTQRTLN